MTTALLPRPTASRPSLAVTLAAFTWRSLLHALRRTDEVVMALALPTMLMLLFTYVFGGAFDPSGGYVQYVVPGTILLCAGFGASSTGVEVAHDLASGVVDRFRTMPIHAVAVVAGHVVVSLVRNLVTTGVVILVALAIGFRPSAGPLEWLAALAIIAGWILAITVVFAAVGLAASGPEAASGMGFVLLFVPYLSSAFVPVATMPGWLQAIAANQPMTPIVESVRALLMGGDASAGLAVAWIAGVLLLGALWAGWLFRRRAGRR